MNVSIKEEMIKLIEEKSTVFKKVSPIQYRTRCPICGDSQKDYEDSHFYIKMSKDITEPLLYNCFLCGAHGRIGEMVLSKFDIDPKKFENLDNNVFNKISSVKRTSIDILTGSPQIDSKQVGYIQSRLGVGFTYEDYDRFKIVWDMNSLSPFISNVNVRNTLPSNKNSITFLSDDKSCIITRYFDDNLGRWNKTNLYNNDNRSFYTIKSTLDLFTSETITVNIAEGVMDVLSVYKNFNDGTNSVYIAVLGSNYESGLLHAVSTGFIGSNIVIKIYLDNDVNEKKLIYIFRKYKWLFKQIQIFKNTKYRDVGTTIGKIKLIEYKV